jgi:L-fucose isomerase-like protein
MKTATLGVVVGNRGFFPAHLCDSGRKTVLSVLEDEGIRAIALTPEDTTYGSVESLSDADRCAKLFREHADEIDGVLVTLPNFGDERAVANTLRWADLGVPVLVHAFPDEVGRMTQANRRDSFCGKLSACDNLNQYGIKFSLTSQHTMDPEGQAFRDDLAWFTATCRVVRGLRNVRVGQLGARPAPFNTVRYSERLLERAGISVEVLDMSDVFGRMERLSDDDSAVRAKREAIGSYVNAGGMPDEALSRMARFAVVVEKWVEENWLQTISVLCWTSIEEYVGIVPCAVMSMLSNSLVPAACEADVTGSLAMLALQLASGTPSALIDWNNNYGEDPNKGVMFHCSNLARHFFAETPKMATHAILADTVGEENTPGTVVGRLKTGPFTFCRVSTDPIYGSISAYVGEGTLTDDPLETFGGYGVFHVPELQALLRFMCENGFEHHAAVNLSQTADAIDEAFGKYLEWDVYRHEG